MAERVELIYKSRDGVTQIHATEWLPEERPPKAVLQIIHGMKEYIERYDAFARYVADRGFIVVGEDHLGHGNTVLSNEDLGYFAAEDADTIVVKDVHRLKKTIQAEHPGLPYFIYGFSMGSFIARKYMTMYGEGVDGVIIGGTGWIPDRLLSAGLGAVALATKIKGERHRSKSVERMVFGKFNEKIKEPRTDFDWICSVDGVVDKFVVDPKCNFRFTLNGYETLFKLIKYIQEPKNAQRIPEELPIMFMSGLFDPLGNYGEGVKKTAEFYMINGMQNVGIKLYDDMRHEIHNEVRKHIVYLDILEWLESQL